MQPQSIFHLAHLSDLHLGFSRRTDQVADRLCGALIEAEVDQVMVTGDITHRGRFSEMKLFWKLFRPLLEAGKVIAIPGNHDRLGENAGQTLMEDRRFDVHRQPGLYAVKLDSTGPHNHSYLAGHGALSPSTVEEVYQAFATREENQLSVLLLHHHLLPLPVETFPEWFSARVGWPYASELALGTSLLDRLADRCELVLHGHRHVPAAMRWQGKRTIHVYNGGSSTRLRRFRIFAHGGGKLIGKPRWVDASEVSLIAAGGAALSSSPELACNTVASG